MYQLRMRLRTDQVASSLGCLFTQVAPRVKAEFANVEF